jgi:hypothetical protein
VAHPLLMSLDMKRLILAAAFCLTATAVVAQVNDTYVIPVAGNTPGQFGTSWQTEISIFNPQTYKLTVSVTLLPTGGGKGSEVLITIPDNAVAHYYNILGTVFHYTGGGALLVATFPEDNPGVPNDVVSRSFLVTTQTYNNTSVGTFGQTIPGTWVGLQDYASEGVSAIAHGISNSNRQAWRTNIGAVNLGRTSVVMRVTVFDFDGNTILKNAPFTIPPLGHMQDRLPVEVDRGAIEFFIDDATKEAVVFPYVSTIDQLSGDPRYQTPVLLATAKFLYGKTAIAPDAVGKKITLSEARTVRENATRLGFTDLREKTER